MATSYVDVLRPQTKPIAFVYNLFWVLAGSGLLALSAQFTIYLGFTPVPINLQTLAVFLIGATLGSKRGSLAVLAYLAEGAMGLPVFSNGGGSLAYLLGPTGGYLIAFVPAAYLVGVLLEKGACKQYTRTLLATTLASMLILAIGTFWLSFYVGRESAIALGVAPFILGEIGKIGATSIFIPTAWKIIN